MRTLLMVAYGAVTVLSLWFVIASVITAMQVPDAFQLRDLPHTGVFMVLFMGTVIFLQVRKPVRHWLIVQVGIVGGLWLATWLSHAFEARTMLLGGLHAICAVAFSVWNLRIVKRG